MFKSLLEHSNEKSKIETWLDRRDISKYTINPDFTVDVDDYVFLSLYEETKLPFKFGKITGDFVLSCPRGLDSSECLPSYVGKTFNLSTNRRLKEIIHGPKYVGGDYIIDDNALENLIGCPKTIYGDFYARHNRLITLEGGPEVVMGDVILASNLLTDLKYSPRKIGGKINFNFNRVESLRYLTFDIKLRKTFIVDIWKNPVKDNGQIERYLQKYLEYHPEETDSLIDMELSDEFYYKNAKFFDTEDIEDTEFETEDEFEEESDI